MKLNKERLNELLFRFKEDDEKYGLIIMLMYVYGRNIREILRLKKEDIDFKHNVIDFNIRDYKKSFSCILYSEVVSDLKEYIEKNNITGFLFHNPEVTFENEIKKVNYFIAKFIDIYNHEIFDFKCPILSSKDFKILRGQHLFIDGVDINLINEFYRSNISITKSTISYDELVKLKFPCNSVDMIFEDYTDLNVFEDFSFEYTDLFTVYDEDNDLLVEVDYENERLKIVSNGDVDFIKKVEGLHSDELFKMLCDVGVGKYKVIGGLKFLKN